MTLHHTGGPFIHMRGSIDIARLFPPAVTAACRPVTGERAELYPQEEAIVTKAVAKRRNEFAAGRHCAREALAALGIPPGPLLQDDAMAPVWPAGIVGAISHSHTWAAAAVARADAFAGIGLDIETVERVTPLIARKVLTPDESRKFSMLTGSEKQSFLALVFSAKEAVYKCLAPIAGRGLGFQDAGITVTGDTRFEARLLGRAAVLVPFIDRLTGCFFPSHGCIFTGIALPR